MHFLTLLLPTLLAFTSTTSAWTQDPNGVWVANDNWHTMGHPSYKVNTPRNTLLVNYGTRHLTGEFLFCGVFSFANKAMWAY
ncbi:hypothetical protein M7I_7452 [Glarea lozoyensis 74030]|uniref:Uncharacterized protein n=1 Tax=Glarea lozoyensis (strain ATCC 74030 / MF5533) TaxID=1104152 RepID=H0EXB8_GLAL7|nr:hypothetical protein M7I_7452 [Glarea lozoyensis 74030]